MYTYWRSIWNTRRFVLIFTRWKNEINLAKIHPVIKYTINYGCFWTLNYRLMHIVHIICFWHEIQFTRLFQAFSWHHNRICKLFYSFCCGVLELTSFTPYKHRINHLINMRTVPAVKTLTINELVICLPYYGWMIRSFYRSYFHIISYDL